MSSRQNELPRTALTHFAMLVLRPLFPAPHFDDNVLRGRRLKPNKEK